MYAEDNSDNDFQPTILYKKRTSKLYFFLVAGTQSSNV